MKQNEVLLNLLISIIKSYENYFNLKTTGKNENLPVNFSVTFIFRIHQLKINLLNIFFFNFFRDNKGRLLPPRPNKKVRNKIGGGGRNECVLHTTKRQKSRAGQESF